MVQNSVNENVQSFEWVNRTGVIKIQCLIIIIYGNSMLKIGEMISL